MKTQIIFIHIPRTGGTSIKKFMSDSKKTCQRVEHVKRKSQMKPMNLDENCFFTNTRHISVGSLLKRGYISQEWWDRSIKFTVVRNPWDRLVSVYHTIRKRKLKRYPCLISFRNFVEEVTSGKSKLVVPVFGYSRWKFNYANPQVEWLRWGVDKILRFENLNHDWKSLCTSVSLEYKTFPHEENSKLDHYSQYYDDDLVERVQIFYQEDIETFGYSFTRK